MNTASLKNDQNSPNTVITITSSPLHRRRSPRSSEIRIRRHSRSLLLLLLLPRQRGNLRRQRPTAPHRSRHRTPTENGARSRRRESDHGTRCRRRSGGVHRTATVNLTANRSRSCSGSMYRTPTNLTGRGSSSAHHRSRSSHRSRSGDRTPKMPMHDSRSSAAHRRRSEHGDTGSRSRCDAHAGSGSRCDAHAGSGSRCGGVRRTFGGHFHVHRIAVFVFPVRLIRKTLRHCRISKRASADALKLAHARLTRFGARRQSEKEIERRRSETSQGGEREVREPFEKGE